MTEDEAKTKWCPYSTARVIRWQKRADTTVNAVYGEPPTTLCIASACMAWRWSETKRTAAFLEAVQAKMQTQDKPNFNTATQAVYADTGGKFERVEGFCGIAGQPS